MIANFCGRASVRGLMSHPRADRRSPMAYGARVPGAAGAMTPGPILDIDIRRLRLPPDPATMTARASASQSIDTPVVGDRSNRACRKRLDATGRPSIGAARGPRGDS
ncbi:hypothetical protein [Salinisphaera orenii]|uniref:hypothetical protein n=1 Tax=Salinisphaera orenii TaxID=856731 RepID=UPI0011CE476A|nr:hypothetical protein [Salinisphaera halophila]